MSKIRPITICIFSHSGKILVCEWYDLSKGELFYRPPGGAIEFGEYSVDTIHREMQEEIGAQVKELVYLGTLENIFVFNGVPGHEIVQVYNGRLVDLKLYAQDVILGYEPEVDQPLILVWKNLDEFGPGKSILYPDGLLEMLNH